MYPTRKEATKVVWHLTRPLWIITDFSVRRRSLPLVIHCGCIITHRLAYRGARQSTAKTAVHGSSKLVFGTTREFYADILCVKLDYYLLF